MSDALAGSGVNADPIEVSVPYQCVDLETAIGQARRLHSAKPHPQMVGLSIDRVGSSDRFYVCVRCLLLADQSLRDLRGSIWSWEHAALYGTGHVATIENRYE